MRKHLINSNFSLTVLLAGGLLAGCATQSYDAKPVVPELLAEQWQQRNLRDPRLHAYLASQGVGRDPLSGPEWSLPELTLAAFHFHPDLELAAARWRVALGAQGAAAQKPNPLFNGRIEHHSKADGVSPWTYGIGIDLAFEADDKRAARLEYADSLTEAARLEIGQTAWQIRNRLRSRLLDLVAAGERMALLRREADLRAEIVALLEARLAAGLIAGSELDAAQVRRQRVEAELDAEASHIPELRAALAAAIGLPAVALVDVSWRPAPFDQVVAENALPADEIRRAALLNRLDIRAALARYAATEAKLRLEVARQRPDLTVGPGYAFDQGDIRWSFGVSLMLALFNNNEGAIAEANAAREVEGRRFAALQAQVIGEQEEALARYRASLNALAAAEKLRRSVAAGEAWVEKQFVAGHADRLELVSKRLESLAAEEFLLAARIKAQAGLGALENCVQRPLDGSAPLAEVSAARKSP